MQFIPNSFPGETRQSDHFRWECDLSGQLTYLSRAAEHLLPPESRQAWLEKLKPQFSAQVSFAGVDQQLSGSDGLVKLQSCGVPIRNAAHRVIGFRGNTRRRLAQVDWKARYQQLFDHMQCGFAWHEMIFDAQGRPTDYLFLAVNPAFEALTGLSTQKVVGRSASETIPGLGEHWLERYGRVATGGEAVAFEEYSHPLQRYYQVSAFQVEPLQFACIFTDITEHRRQSEQLKLLASVFESCQEGVMITDAHNVILQVNEAFTKITGYSSWEVLGKTPSLLSSGLQNRAFYEGMWCSLREHRRWRGEIWNRRKDGEVYAEMLSISAVTDTSGSTTHYVAVFSDISRVKAHQDELYRIAHYDVLTGVPNRRLFMERLHQAVALSRRRERALALCYVDLDGFKPVNDRWGHAAGDQLLIEMTRRLNEVLREVDTLARLGGDEFVILLGELHRSDEVHGVLIRILECIRKPFLIQGEEVSVTASLGVTLFPDDPSEPDGLLRHADQAMYQAKMQGKNGYVVYSQEAENLPIGMGSGEIA